MQVGGTFLVVQISSDLSNFATLAVVHTDISNASLVSRWQKHFRTGAFVARTGFWNFGSYNSFYILEFCQRSRYNAK